MFSPGAIAMLRYVFVIDLYGLLLLLFPPPTLVWIEDMHDEADP